MPVIIIAYTTHEVEGQTVRIYKDFTEKYFVSSNIQDAKDYITYLTTSKGYTVDVSEIVINNQGDFNVNALIEQDALAKLTDKEKEVLGL